MSHVGQEIRRLREERDLNQAQLAVLVGTGPAAISRIETGKQNPNSATLSRIAQALDVEVADLFPKAQAPLPLELVEDPPKRGSVSLTRQLDDWHHFFELVAERWTREVHSGALFATSDGAIAYSIAANTEAAQLFEIIGSRLLPTADGLSPESVAKNERRKLERSISWLDTAIEAVNKATRAAAPELDEPIELNDEDLDEAIRTYEEQPELEKHRHGREVAEFLDYLAMKHAKAEEELRRYRSA